MADQPRKIDPAWAWEPFRPSASQPWNYRRVGHLYRRASFGVTLADLETGRKLSPEKCIDGLLAGGKGLAEFDQTMAPLAETLSRTNNGLSLRAWWLTRMLYSPHPLQEKMTLFWHNHFATSNAKVQNARFMLGQYQLLRKHALGNFADLLRGMSADPAMLVWLDGRGSKKGNPNENYARELMELFSLGIGNYTEKDIREAARAFTGWEVTPAGATFSPAQFDGGEKSVLKQQGTWKPDDIVRICLEQPACPFFLCTKLFRFLVSDTIAPTRELLAPLAETFRTSGYDFGAVVRRVLSSNLFFSDEVYRSQVKSPVDFTLGIVRALEGRIGTSALAQVLEQLGQNVFYPPSVKGWDGGQAWLNGQTLLFRQNLALAFSSTEDPRFGTRIDPAALARKYGKSGDEELVEFFVRLLLQGDIPPEVRQKLIAYMKKSHTTAVPVYWTAEDAAAQRVRSLCHLILALPQFQLQ
ncbi:MAG: DUF1800 domain-containing protein [Gemmataceae bacterium]